MFSRQKKDNESFENIKLLRTAPPLLTPRYEDPPGDDMDECETPPYWNELTKEEKTDILDYDIDQYWQEYFDSIREDINWWKYSTYFFGISSIYLLLQF
tara:strand:- start:9 stop:305 length:297 start_codon:yes stop_codon:yes gene_type:complete